MTNFVGYPSSYRAPFTAMQLLFGQGPSNAPAGPRSAMYMGPKTAAGTANVNQAYTITSEADAITLFGVGSPVHRALRRHLLASTLGTLIGICYAPSSGGSPVAAAGTITITFTSGSNPTATGQVTTYVAGEVITTGFNTADTATTIAANIVLGINAKVWLPVTATSSVGVVTITAKIAGASQGDGTVGVIRLRTIADAGKNVISTASGAALGLGTGTVGVDGTTTELVNMTGALSTLTNTRYYYNGFTMWSAAALAVIATHVSAKSQANPGLRCRAFTAYTGTGSAVSALAIAVNFERQHIVHQTNSEWDTADLVGNAIAIHQSQEAGTGDFVPDNYRGKDWMCPAAYSNADWPTSTQINQAVTDGVIEVASDQYGSFMVMSVTTRSRDSGGTISDFRATETHRISFLDAVGDRWLIRDAVQYGVGFKLTPDQLMPDGSINFNQKVPPFTLTPSLYKPFAAAQIQEAADNGEIQGASTWLNSLICSIDPNNISRLVVTASGRTIDIRHQTGIQLSETTPG